MKTVSFSSVWSRSRADKVALRSCRRNLRLLSERQHMLQRGLRLHTNRAGKHGPHRRTHSRVHTQNQHGNRTKGSQDGLCHERNVQKTANSPDYNSACKGIHGSQVRLGQKMFHTLPVSLVTRSGGSRISASAYRAQTQGGSVWEAAPSMAFSILTLSPLLRRVIVVALSRRVLATDPCWHSFSQRHVTAYSTTQRHGSRSAALIGRARRRLALKGAL